VLERFLTGRLDRVQSIAQHTGEDRHHLPVTIIGGLELAAHLLQGGRENPVLERCAIAQSPGLAGQHRHVVLGVVDHLVAAEAAGMFAHDHPVLADDDAVGIGMDLDRTTDGARQH